MTRRNNPVQIHQAKEDSVNSVYSASSGSYDNSSSGSSTPRSLSPGEYREYDAAGHSSFVTFSGPNVLVAHNKVGYDANAPHASYGGSYSRR